MNSSNAVTGSEYLSKRYLLEYFWKLSADNMFIVAQNKDGNFSIIDFNPMLIENLGIPAKDYNGCNMADVFGQNIADVVKLRYLHCIDINKPYSYTECVEYNGSIRYWNTLLIPVLETETGFPNVFGISREMTDLISTQEQLKKLNAELEETVMIRTQELEQSNNRLRTLASTDALTQIGNRRFFFEHAADLFNQAKENKLFVSLLYIDIDHFKQLNDTYGHFAGDEILKGLALRLKHTIRPTDILCRFGGEEFIILLPISSPKLATEKALEILNKIRNQPFYIDDKALPLTSSIGLATVNSSDSYDLDHLINDADKALYLAKHNGRNRIEIYN